MIEAVAYASDESSVAEDVYARGSHPRRVEGQLEVGTWD